MKCICREIKLNIDSILFLIVKKRKVDDVDDLEPSTSTGLPMKVQSNYMHHLTWFYIIVYRCVRFVGTFIIHHLIFPNDCFRKRCNVQVLQRVQACVSGRSRYLPQMQSTSCLFEMQVSSAGALLHLKRC